MKKPFEVGDRVRVYDIDRYQNKAVIGQGTVDTFDGKNLMTVDMDKWDPPGKFLVTFQQCRRLKPKPRPEKKGPRHFWIRHDRYGHPTAVAETLLQKQQEDDAVIECIELTPDSRLVTREDLIALVSTPTFDNAKTYQDMVMVTDVERLGRALGFQGEK